MKTCGDGVKKDVLLIANYWHFDFEKASSRYRSMADILCENDMDVEVVTSSFRHQTKCQRDVSRISSLKYPYKVTLLNEPSYNRNISLRRIYSHHAFACAVSMYLKSRKKPDVIIVSVPSLSVGSAVTKYANQNNVRVIVDIQDLWPEAFRMAINIPIVSDVLFTPMMLQANKIYARADRIMAVSETYVQRGLSVNRKDPVGLSVYIGTDSMLVTDVIACKCICKPKEEFWVGYIGALGHSYDIKLIIEAIALLQTRGIQNIVFKIMGEGILADEFKRYASEKHVNCHFMGFISYGEMMNVLRNCDIAVNPIIGQSVSTIINKVSDYAMAGMPVINTQNSHEYRMLIDHYECGVNCENGNPEDVAEAISRLYHDASLRREMGNNAEKMATERFDRRKTYQKIVTMIQGM